MNYYYDYYYYNVLHLVLVVLTLCCQDSDTVPDHKAYKHIARCTSAGSTIHFAILYYYSYISSLISTPLSILSTGVAGAGSAIHFANIFYYCYISGIISTPLSIFSTGPGGLRAPPVLADGKKAGHCFH